MNKLEDDQELKKAKKYLNRLFSIRPRSEKEIVKRFTRKGFSTQVISQVTDYAKEKNLINDARFAQIFVEDRLNRKPKGKFALRRELQAKGIEEDIIQRTLEEAFEGVDVSEMIKELAQKRLRRYRGENKQSRYRKTMDFLKRRGFSLADIYEIVRKLVFNESDPINSDIDNELPH